MARRTSRSHHNSPSFASPSATGKRLSQNFLHSPAAVRRVVRAARLPSDATVLEPGAGKGALTSVLARSCRRLVAYEVDPRLAGHVASRMRAHTHVRVVCGDFAFAEPPGESFAVVGNIPFSRTSDIVRWCLDAPHCTSATLLTELDYARKRTGGHGRWSLLTVRTWPEHKWRLAGTVRSEDFVPVPRCDAGVLRIERRAEPLLPRGRLAAYDEFVAFGFTGLGGSLLRTLGRRYPRRRLRAVFRELGLPEAVPVGHVGPQQWLALFRELAGSGR